MEGLPHANPRPARAGRIIVLVLLMLGIVRVMCDGLPDLLRDDLFLGDAAQHTWWTYRFDDPDLFPHDLAYDYYSLPVYSPYGYQTYMRVLVRVFDAQHVAEATGILLALASMFFTWRLGLAIGGRPGAAAALLVFTLINVGDLTQGGFPRDYALPLLLAGVLAVYQRKWPIVGLILLLITFFYPPVVFNLVPVVAGVLLIGIVRTRRLPRGFWIMTALAILAMAMIAIVYLRPVPAWAGRFYTFDEARHMAEWSRFGRTAFFRPWRSYYFNSSTAGIGLTPYETVGFGTLLVLSVILVRRAISLEAWLILFAGLGFWAFAHAVLFKLYLPSRYLIYALPTFAILWSIGVGREIRHRFRRWIDRPNINYRRIAVAICVISALVYGGLLTSRAVAIYRGPPMWDMPDGYENAITVLFALPANTRVAAHPNDANAIPLRARKSVLANTETTIAFNTAYYGEMKKRLNASFDMLYATDWPTIDSIAKTYGIGVFLLDRRRLTDPQDRPYFEPFQTDNVARIQRGIDQGFAMLHPPADRVLFQSGSVVLLRVGKGAP